MILLYPFVVMAYLTFNNLMKDFQDIAWSNMTVYKMTLGDRLVYYFKIMTVHNFALSMLFLYYFIIVLNFMYALILSVVCARYNEIMMVHHGQKQDINNVNAIFFWMIKQKKAVPQNTASGEFLQDQDIAAQECAAYERGFLGHKISENMSFKQQQERHTKDLTSEEFNKAIFEALLIDINDSTVNPKDWGQNCAEQIKKELVYRAELRSCYINATRRLETL